MAAVTIHPPMLHYRQGTLFGFPGQSTTLAFGDDGTTFTLTTSNGPVLNGTITFGSCTLTQNPVPLDTGAILFAQTYDACQVTGQSDDDIEFSGSGTATITLILGNASITPVASSPTRVITMSPGVGISRSATMRRA